MAYLDAVYWEHDYMLRYTGLDASQLLVSIDVNGPY
jgi:hypothetical protein